MGYQRRVHGTHPIFESDFDCLTEMRFTRVLRGGSNWSAVPPEKLPPPQLWNKLIPGTPYAEVQKELHKRGLHDPWMRKWFFSYDNVMRRPYTLAGALNSTIIKKAMMVTLFLVFLEDCLGLEWKNLHHGNAGMWNRDAVNIIAVKAPTGDEHIKNYRGWGGLDMKYIGHETPQTKGT